MSKSEFNLAAWERLTRPNLPAIEAAGHSVTFAPVGPIEELLEWASQHSNVTPLDGTDRNSPTFGTLRDALRSRVRPKQGQE